MMIESNWNATRTKTTHPFLSKKSLSGCETTSISCLSPIFRLCDDRAEVGRVTKAVPVLTANEAMRSGVVLHIVVIS